MMMINGRMNEAEGKYGGRSDVEEGKADERMMMGRREKMPDDTASLCEECRRAEESGAERSAEEQTRELSRRLAQQIREMNRAEMDRRKARMSEERQQEEREWMEAEERQRTVEEAREDERRAKSAAKDEEQGRWREENKRREETEMSNLGWLKAAGGVGAGSSTFLSLDNGLMRTKKYGQKKEEGLMKRLDDQLRRNETLRKSVERLEQFKERQREEDERARSRASETRRAALAMERARSTSSSTAMRGAFYRSPSSGRCTRQRDMATASPVRSRVYEAWKEAREADEERYRILQEGGGKREEVKGMKMIGEWKRDEEEDREIIRGRKRCRKCNRSI